MRKAHKFALSVGDEALTFEHLEKLFQEAINYGVSLEINRVRRNLNRAYDAQGKRARDDDYGGWGGMASHEIFDEVRACISRKNP